MTTSPTIQLLEAARALLAQVDAVLDSNPVEAMFFDQPCPMCDPMAHPAAGICAVHKLRQAVFEAEKLLALSPAIVPPSHTSIRGCLIRESVGDDRGVILLMKDYSAASLDSDAVQAIREASNQRRPAANFRSER